MMISITRASDTSYVIRRLGARIASVQYRETDGWRVCPSTTSRRRSRKGWPTAEDAVRSYYNTEVAKLLAGARPEKPYEVINLENLRSHGEYPTVDEARGCVAFDGLAEWQIWYNGTTIVDQREAN